MPNAIPTTISIANSLPTIRNEASSWVAYSSIPIISAIPTGSFAPDSPSRIVPVRPPISRRPSTENITAGSVGASAAPRIPAVIQPKPKSQCAASAIRPAVAKVPSSPSAVIGRAAARKRCHPTSMPPSKRIAMSATAAIRSTSTVERRSRPGQISEVTAAMTRKSAGAGIGKRSVTLYAPIASENVPATRRTIRPNSVSSVTLDTLAVPVSSYSLFADLPLLVQRVTLEGRELAVTPQFLRRTTVVRLEVGGEEGVGEDVVYEADDQERFQAAGPPPGLAGEHTLAFFSTRLEGLPELRRWGFEAAA